MKMKLLFSAGLCLLSAASFAAEVTGKIESLTTFNDGHTVIKIQNGPRNGCPSGYWYSLGTKGKDAKAEPMLAVALAAYMSGKTVAINTTDGSCSLNEEKVNSINILP